MTLQVTTMTLSEIKSSDKPMLTPADIAEVLGSNPQDIRITAQQHPAWLGFPVIRVGNHIKIPRKGFLEFMREE